MNNLKRNFILFLFRIKTALLAFKQRPVVEISRAGQLTNNPKVSASILSRNSMMTIFTEKDDDQGNARIEMYAKSLSSSTGARLFDRRPYQIQKLMHV